ncbi:transmembrane protein 268 [Rhinatrema bivittatum]|uniref:transmembrane protein 268 n=1 Tax=Rhinatrema bivittatum TaxID=194408 RepID=UPI00112A253E|nr:transmembrane protein 268 [Rhinatrema bivittatum]
MACIPQATQLEESDCVSASVSYSRSLEHSESIYWEKGLYNGQVLAVLQAQNGSSFIPGSMEVCMEKLKASGIQIPLEHYMTSIENTIFKPEVRRYLFFNSRFFAIILAVVFYVSMWVNIYCMLQMFSFGRHWLTSIFVSFGATAATIAIMLIIDHHQRKLNVNTDVSLAAANENFMKYNVLIGVTDFMDSYQNVLQLWFVHFNLERCLQTLCKHLAELRRRQQSDLRCLKQLSIVIETVIEPGPEEREEQSKMWVPSEESPLLSSHRNSKREIFKSAEVIPLIPESVPRVMAHQLLIIFSGCYVRLLVAGQLPHTAMGRHTGKINCPCLCQFIEISALHSGHCWFGTR